MHFLVPECLAKGSCFKWGSGGRTLFFGFFVLRSLATVGSREVPDALCRLCGCSRCAVGIGGRRVVWVVRGGAVSWGLVGGLVVLGVAVSRPVASCRVVSCCLVS